VNSEKVLLGLETSGQGVTRERTCTMQAVVFGFRNKQVKAL